MIELGSVETLELVQISFVNIGLFVSIILVVAMQPGFMMLEVGSISRLNVINDIYKNALDFCVGALAFWLVGYDILTGDSALWTWLEGSGLVQQATPGPTIVKPVPVMEFLFHLAFATTAATICSGAVTARMAPHPYVVFSAIFTGLIYPIVAFLVWNEQSVFYGVFRDFAGSVVVHSAGAAAGLAGTLLLRPRIGFNGYDPTGVGPERLFRLAKRHAPHNMPIAALGVFILWLGWFGFNGGTLLAGHVQLAAPDLASGAWLETSMSALGSIVAATILGPCACALTLAAMNVLFDEDLNLLETLNGVVAGAVAVTAAADLLTPAQAVAAGAAGALVFRTTRRAFVRLSIDDPVSAIAAHGFTGVFGAAVVGFVAEDASAMLAGTQLVGGLSLFAFVFFGSLIAFKIAEWISRIIFVSLGRGSLPASLKMNFLRIDAQVEIEGMDTELHGQQAYGPGTKDGAAT